MGEKQSQKGVVRRAGAAADQKYVVIIADLKSRSLLRYQAQERSPSGAGFQRPRFHRYPPTNMPMMQITAT